MNQLPHYNSLANALVSLYGPKVAITNTDRLSGGDINKAYGLTLNTGDKVFMKANAKENLSFFKAEAAGLRAMAQTKTIPVAELLCTGTDDGEEAGYSFLFLKFIEYGNINSDFWTTFGRKLADMHNAKTKLKSGKFGFDEDNFIGSRTQLNTPRDSFVTFFRDMRLLPQFKAADSYFTKEDRTLITKLLDHLDDFLIEPEKPSLLHGDLWSGNIICNKDGQAVLIDPASYVGHAEADIAMTELFGAFPAEFYDAYREVHPLAPGYENRRDLYNLYQLLNHLNIFGADYLQAVQSIIREYVA